MENYLNAHLFPCIRFLSYIKSYSKAIKLNIWKLSVSFTQQSLEIIESANKLTKDFLSNRSNIGWKYDYVYSKFKLIRVTIFNTTTVIISSKSSEIKVFHNKSDIFGGFGHYFKICPFILNYLFVVHLTAAKLSEM